MPKKILIAVVILVVLSYAGITYLNKVFLPIKIKSLIIQGLEEQTRKKVSLGSLQFNIFKGLVLRDLAIKDADKTLISLKEADCSLLIWPFFKKQIIIPAVHIKSAAVYVERRSDNTFNISEIFAPKQAQGKKNNAKFNLIVSKLSISESCVNFQDNAISPAFTKSAEDINLVLNLSLPAAVKFKLKATIPAKLAPMKILAAGQYKLPQKQLSSKINIIDLSPQEFSNYYQQFGFSLPTGLITANSGIILENNLLSADLNAETKELAFFKAPIKGRLNSDIRASIKYDLKAKELNYSGNFTILNSDISGLEFIDTVKNISAKISFNNSGFSSDKLNADILGIPVEAKLKLEDFNKPLLNINLSANPELSFIQGILSDKFKLNFPGQIKGNSRLSLNLQTTAAAKEIPQITGNLDISNASLKFEKINNPFEAINGRFVFSSTQLNWEGLVFRYSGIDYKTSGALNNFRSPTVNLQLNSPNLTLQSEFRVKDKLINIAETSGKYFNSDFSLSGKINFAQNNQLQAGINGELNIELHDLDKILEKHKEKLLKIKPEGKVQAKFALEGNLNNLKSSFVKADLSSPSISAYGLHSGEAAMEASLRDGLINITSLEMVLYDGILVAAAKVNLNSTNFPFLLEANLQNVKLEKLKLDTPAKDNDISGIIQTQAKLSGFAQDFSKLNGQGQILVTDGRLWQLNFFKGMGKLLFSIDFTNIVFNAGSCNFVIADQYISTSDLQLKSTLVNLSGTVRIGFDSSIDATLKAQIAVEAPLTGSVKDIATTILGQAEKFGVIRIGGTLKEPKYSFQPAVVDIINTIKDIFWKK